ncbi:MAG: hypothetical protein GXO77_16770, partial [Calditrichaeota bacterium]|nr:hypothetical protein [Calditrichota bacterium]
MKYFFLFVFYLLSFVLLLTCQKLTEPLYNTANLQLSVKDVSCTEVWLSLKTGKDFYNQTLKLYRDDSLIIEKALTTTDSILLVENLQPATQYAFNASVYDGDKLLAKSSAV